MNTAKDIDFWRLSNKLEEGRNLVLRMVARNEGLELILNTLCQKAQIYSPSMLCSILQLDNECKTLHPIASVSLPDFYCQALDGVAIGAGVGSCGTAAFTKERVVVEDINTHPYWAQYKGLALEAGVQACWSEPIIGADGIVFGTFAIYYRTPKQPSKEDIKFIELSANLAAVVFENNSNRIKLLSANKRLKQTIDERTRELEKVNLALEKSIREKNKQHISDIYAEKMLTTNSLICGFSHEINTPIGTVITAISIAEEKIQALSAKVANNELSKKFFIHSLAELVKTIELSKKELQQVSYLTQQFKNINTFNNVQENTSFAMLSFLNMIKESVAHILGAHQLHIHCSDFGFYSNKEVLWQIFFNLIENSIIHGFKEIKRGMIHINIVEDNQNIIINYQDNGCGVSKEDSRKIFEPFYTSNRNKKSLGLGLNITNNLINHNLQGKIKLIDSPVGIRYEIILPKQLNDSNNSTKSSSL